MTVSAGFHTQEATRLLVLAREGTRDTLPSNRMMEALVESNLEIAAAIDRATEALADKLSVLVASK